MMRGKPSDQSDDLPIEGALPHDRAQGIMAQGIVSGQRLYKLILENGKSPIIPLRSSSSIQVVTPAHLHLAETGR
jgi:hypothetical protein